MALATVGVLVVLPGSAASAQHGAPAGSWPYYGGDAGGTKYSPLDQIDEGNVDQLTVLWRWSSPDNGVSGLVNYAFESTPLAIDGVLYTSTSFSQAAAIDGATGRTIWVFDPQSYQSGRPPNNGFLHRGVAFWQGNGKRRVLYATGDARLFSLDAATGVPDPQFGVGGAVDLRAGIPRLAGSSIEYGNTSPPMVVGNVVVVGSSIHDGIDGPAGPPGDVRGFDAATGEHLWTFHTVPRPGEFGYETWQAGSAEYSGHTNVWAPMTADLERGTVYLPVSAPTNNYFGGARPGDNLFGNSLVCLDARTGRRIWHFQTVHHDIWDYDLGSPPNLVDIRVGGRRIPAVAQVTKQGFTFVFDRRTGAPVWPIEERPVPSSTIVDEETSPTQPFPTKPPPFALQGLRIEDLSESNRDDATARIAPYDWGSLYLPPSQRGTILLPGIGGGANWGGASFDPETRRLYVTPLGRLPFLIALEARGAGLWAPSRVQIMTGPGNQFYLLRPPYGTLVAIDLDRGAIAWERPNFGSDGVAGQASSMVTKTLLFYTNRSTQVLQVYDKESGARLRQIPLGAAASGAPMTYQLDGRQVVVVAVGRDAEPMELVALGLAGELPSGSGRIEWQERSTRASEGTARVELRVLRSGGGDGEVSVEIEDRGTTGASAATVDADFRVDTSTVTWLDGETGAKTVSVSLLDDALVEGEESFELLLANPMGGAVLGEASEVAVTIEDDDFAPCAPTADVLCLQGARFAVEVDFRAQDGTSGSARAVSLTSDTGYFTFFDPSNVEVVVKVLDACVLFERFFVFAAGLTDVEVTLRVTDTVAGRVETWVSPLGRRFEPILDTSTFATCTAGGP